MRTAVFLGLVIVGGLTDLVATCVDNGEELLCHTGMILNLVVVSVYDKC